MSLPQAIKTMLEDVTLVSNDEVTFGSRNQNSVLPAIFFQINSNETLTVGSSPLRKAEVIISSVAQTAEESQSIAEAVMVQLDTGTYNSIVFQGVANKNSVLQQPSSSFGEETNPFICITTADIFYKE